MYVTARATPARRWIAHKAKQKTLFLEKSFAKPQWKNLRWGFLFLGGSALRAAALYMGLAPSVLIRTSTLYLRRVFLQVTFFVR